MEMVKYAAKPGVVLYDLHPILARQIPLIARIWQQETGTTMRITAGRDGEHSTNSLHYYGRAIDIGTRQDWRVWSRIPGQQLERARARLLEQLEPAGGWDIIIEGDHVHLELDWRADALLPTGP